MMASGFISFQISCSFNELFHSERRFDASLSVRTIKDKMELITGANAQTMRLELFDKEGNLLSPMRDDQLLSELNAQDGYRIHVIDKTGIYTDQEGGNVKKYEISEKDYAQRSNSVRHWMAQSKLGRFDEEQTKRLAEQKEQETAKESVLISQMKVGDRCKVTLQSGSTCFATIRYLGDTVFKGGKWVGVQYDEPMGKNDGSVEGKRYFECTMKYGGFVRPDRVEIGDFPEETFESLEQL